MPSKTTSLLGVALLCAAGAPAQGLTNGLIFYAPFSASFNDTRGGLPGTALGGAAWVASGGVSGGYLSLTNRPAATPPQCVYFNDPTPATGDFSFQIWVRAANPLNGQTSADPAIAANKDWDSGANVGWVISRYIPTGTEFKWNFNAAGGQRADFNPASATAAEIFDGRWHQVAVVFQRNGAASTYRDGVVVNVTDISADAGESARTPLNSWVTNNILALGQDATLRYDHASGTSVSSLNGDLDEAGMWDRALGPIEVLTAYIKGTNGLSLETPLGPMFVAAPEGASRMAGQSYQFTPALAGDAPVNLQWFKNGAPLAGDTNASLALPNLSTNDAGTYALVASWGNLSVTSAPAALTVEPLITNVTHTIQDVRHVVIFMQENRSFDHYFGTMAGVRGFGDTAALMLTNGASDFYQPWNGSYVLPFAGGYQCLVDLDHSWATGHQAWNGGNWNAWVGVKGATTMAYYTRNDIPFQYALADAYTVCDNYHCGTLGPTNPNRLYLWTGMIDPEGTGGGPVIDNSELGYSWTTYPERLQAAGVSWKVYQEADNYDDNALEWFAQYRNALPGNPLYDRGEAVVPDLLAAFAADVTNDTLPRVSWLIAPAALSEHPSFSPDSGANLTWQLLNALASNPAVYNSTVFMLTYDENDGFFDHVPSPTPPPGTPDEFVDGLPIGLGARVPMVLVSPWSRGGYVCSQLFDHTSIIRFLEAWTGVREPNISAWRRQVCGDLTTAFDFQNPNTNYPSLPLVDAVSCSDGITPTVPSPQAFPVQETGHLIERPLPYQPNAICAVDCAAGRVAVFMTNAGAVAEHFSIYANAFLTNGPWQYDASANASATDTFNLEGADGGSYDLTCYAANGFLRRWAGNSHACGAAEVVSSIGGESITLTMENLGDANETFRVTNSVRMTEAVYQVQAGQSVNANFDVVLDDDGWYDLTVSVDGLEGFLRRLAGHVETDRPPMRAGMAGGNLVLTYPDWAAGYVLEESPTLQPGSWATANAAATLSNKLTTATLPAPAAGAEYFRLRR